MTAPLLEADRAWFAALNAARAGENTAHQAEIIDAIARDQRRSSEAGDLIR